MFFNNFINNIIMSMIALCVVTSGWSMGKDGLENFQCGTEVNADVAQKRANDIDEDSISKRNKNGSPISVNTPPPYNNGDNSSQTLAPGQQPNEENSNTRQLLKSPSFSDASSLGDSEDESEYAWPVYQGTIFYVNVPTNYQDTVAKQITEYDSKSFAKQMCSALLSDLPESVIREILKTNLEEILNMSDEDFAQNLAYPLMRSPEFWKGWDDAETLKTLKNLIHRTALSLGVIGETFKGDIPQILQLLNQYALR